MRYGILGDIHGNIVALEAVLKALERDGFDCLASVGDIVGYNPWPLECVQIATERCQHIVVGNHDYGLIGLVNIDYFNPVAADALAWTEAQLPVEHFEFFENLPLIAKTEHCGFVHASANQPQDFKYVFPESDPSPAMAAQDRRVFFYGHTHCPVAFFKGPAPQVDDSSVIPISNRCMTLINVGSVGQPRDGDPRAAYALYDTDRRVVEIRRVKYDIKKTADKIIEVGLPRMLADRLFSGQ